PAGSSLQVHHRSRHPRALELQLIEVGRRAQESLEVLRPAFQPPVFADIEHYGDLVPCLVTNCGPSDVADRTTSLNRCFASCNCQRSFTAHLRLDSLDYPTVQVLRGEQLAYVFDMSR